MTQPPQANGEDMIAATDPDRPPPRCAHCGADAFGCAVKLGLGGRRCCDRCDHGDHDRVDHGDHDRVNHQERHQR